FALLFERPRGAAAGHERRESRAVDHAFVEIEAPVPGLTRHQDAQEPPGQARDHWADRSELGFELQVQFRELCATSECGRVDNAIVRGGVRVIAITWAATLRTRTRACRLLG